MKFLTVSTLLLASSLLASAPVHAQSSTGTSNEAATTDSSFWSADWMRGFYTDDSMTTVRPAAEAQAAFAQMTPENQAKLRSECQGTYDRKYSDICMAATQSN